MDELFLKERALCVITSEDEFIKGYLQCIERAPSRKVSEALILRLQKNEPQVEQILSILEEITKILKRQDKYTRERLKRKLDPLRLIREVIEKPVRLTEEQKSILFEFISETETRAEKEKDLQQIKLPQEIVQIEVLKYIADLSKAPETEKECTLKMIYLLKSRLGHIQAHILYLEEILKTFVKYITDNEFTSRVSQLVSEDWLYNSTIPAQSILLALSQKKQCSYEHILNRKISLQRIPINYIVNSDTQSRLESILCAIAIVESEETKSPIVSHSTIRYIKCPILECNEEVHVSHIEYYQMHKRRKDSELKKTLDRILQAYSTKEERLVSLSILHRPEYRTHLALKYIINALKKIDKRRESIAAEEEQENHKQKILNPQILQQDSMRRLLRSIQAFEMVPQNEQYIIGQIRGAVQSEQISKMITTLNIVYYCQSTPKIAFGLSLLVHGILQLDQSSFIETVINGTIDRHSQSLEESKGMILDYFILQLSDTVNTSVALNTLSKVFQVPNLSTFIERYAYYLVPRLSQINCLEEYYSSSTQTGIYTALYAFECKNKLAEKEKSDIRNILMEDGLESVITMYLSLESPKDILKRCDLELSTLLSTCHLIQALISTRRALEERIVPYKNCIFLLLLEIVKIATLEMNEIIEFLISTKNITGSSSCRCLRNCAKESFWSFVLEAISENSLTMYKYMIALEFTSKQIEVLEQRVGVDKNVYLNDALSLEESLGRVYFYLTDSIFMSTLAIYKVLPVVLRSTEEQILAVSQSDWKSCKAFISHCLRLYSHSKDRSLLEALSLFGLLGIDALEEEESTATRASFYKKESLIDMNSKKEASIYMFFIENILIPAYYEIQNTLILYIIQEILKYSSADSIVQSELPHREFLTRLRHTKYTLETGELRREKTQLYLKYSNRPAYKKGISHQEFLFGVFTKLSIYFPEKEKYSCLIDDSALINSSDQNNALSIYSPILSKALLIIENLLEENTMPIKYILEITTFYVYLMMVVLKDTNLDGIREVFMPVFWDVREKGLIDRDILILVLNSSICIDGIFLSHELLLCSEYLQDSPYSIWLLDKELRKDISSIERDTMLTRVQKEHLKLKEKDVVFGINAAINKLSPTNLAAELVINNEYANLQYINREILKEEKETTEKDQKYNDVIVSQNKKSVQEVLLEVQQKIEQWSENISLQSFNLVSESTKSFLVDAHILRDCKVLLDYPLPDALSILRTRRECVRTYENIRVSNIHGLLLSVYEETESIQMAKKDALLTAIQASRKSGQYELSEQLVIKSIVQDDWRVFYEKAQLHMLKNNKSLAKQALSRLSKHLSSNHEYQQKAMILSTEIEGTEELFKRILSQLKTDESVYFGYGKYLEKKSPTLAFKMFCSALCYGKKKSTEIIPKIIHAIADNEYTSASTIEHIKEYVGELHKTLQKIDISLFKPYFSQIITRLHHRIKPVEEILSTIALKVIEEYPEETLWKCISLINNKDTSKADTLKLLISRASYRVKTYFVDLCKFTGILNKINEYPCAGGNTTLTSILGAPLVLKKGIAAPFGDFKTEILSIDDKVYVFPSLQRPKKLKILMTTGVFKSFLCKANDDLRKDARFMDLILLFNSLFKSDDACRSYSIRTYTVIPITPSSGIIEYLENTLTLKSICETLYSEMNISLKEYYARGKRQQNKRYGSDLENILKSVPPVFSEFFRRTFVTPAYWLQVRKRYTVSYSVMTAVGYLMGLGDRHTENILFDSKTGETVHVDLNCIFDKALDLPIPETVPFRLTQNILDAFGPTKQEGRYRLTLERTFKFLSLRKDLIVANLQGFVHDPLGEWTGRNNSKTAMQVIERAKDKIDIEDEIAIASTLIDKSTSIKNLSAMFFGWLPFI
ncbi:serine/threonine-protein kinase ATR [Nematocida sp. AWRm80]|nr:serine/threonine-protein kinase ATR [Nematocida sp. AWRm80]